MIASTSIIELFFLFFFRIKNDPIPVFERLAMLRILLNIVVRLGSLLWTIFFVFGIENSTTKQKTLSIELTNTVFSMRNDLACLVILKEQALRLSTVY